MASSENHTADGDDNYEDQEAKELFESFMDITKDVEAQEEDAEVVTKEENTLKEDIRNTTEKPEPEPLSTDDNDGNTSIDKRLSKAVVELSDLEKQLSLMLCSGANLNKNQDTDSLDASSGVSKTTSNIISTESGQLDNDVKDGNDLNACQNQCHADYGTTLVQFPETSLKVIETADTNGKASPNTDGTVKQNNDAYLENVSTCQLNTNNTNILTEDKGENKTPLLSMLVEKERTDEDTEVVIEINRCSPSLSSSANDLKEVQDKNEGDEIDQEAESNISMDNSSTAEIVMTDECGIAEHKSLDSLETVLDDLHSDSLVLSDEGIDSDAKSLDDLDDDATTFHSNSLSDLTLEHKTQLLSVDRNRFGSNSSTLSEKEFRTSASLKSDSEEFEKAQLRGYLLKLGGSGITPRNWRKRWFILKEDNCLYYYKHSKDKIPCGVIVLCNYSVTKAPDSSKKYCFKLNKGGARTYHFCASNDNDMREWMVALMKAAAAQSASGTSFQILEGNVHNVSIPALSIKDPECHGYLSKKGSNIKSWKRRYCVLKNGYLYYYSDMSNTTALGVAKLIGYEIKCGETRGKHFSFYGSPPKESMRVFHFSAETENDRERWMTRMEESIGKGSTSE